MSVKFCKETKEGRKINTNGVKTLSSYVASNVLITSQNTITMNLTNSTPNNQQAANLVLELTFYQEGLMQGNISCPGEDPRFGISSTGIGVEWSQLNPVTNLSFITDIRQDKVSINLSSSNGKDNIQYVVTYSPFKIIQYVNSIVTLVINDDDSLRYAALDAPHNTYMDGTDQLIEGYEIGVGFTLSADYTFGLPQRASDTFVLKTNENYRLFNQDKFVHPYGSNDPLYGSWPYLTGHSAVMDASVAWMNSSETYVQLETTTNSITAQSATEGYFVSVGGKFEFFVFGTTQGPKQN